MPIKPSHFAACFLVLIATGRSSAADAAPEYTPIFVEKYCLQCHGDKVKKADLTLQGYRDSASVAKGRATWLKAIQMVEQNEMPPPSRPQPTLQERQSFLNMLKAIFEHHDRNAKLDPGRVTIRRLNRVEYNNTIRDLLGIELNASEDFPSDDVGHGFDNIGDVLTLSTVLFERYLTAAESIAAASIQVKEEKPPTRIIAGKYLQPGGNPMGPRLRSFEKGTLTTSFQVTLDGEYHAHSLGFSRSPRRLPKDST